MGAIIGCKLFGVDLGVEARCCAGEGAERNAAVEAEGTGLATDSPHVERDAAQHETSEIHIDCCFPRDAASILIGMEVGTG